MTPTRGGKKVEAGNEIWVPAAVFFGTAIAAFIGYFRKLPAPKAQDPVIAGIAVAYGDREQTERLIGEVKRCATALEVLADRRTEEIEEMHQKLLDRLDRAEQQQRPHRPARRRT